MVGAAASIIFCRLKRFVATNTCLSRQLNVEIISSLSQQNMSSFFFFFFFLPQKYAYDKIVFVATNMRPKDVQTSLKDIFCCDKLAIIATFDCRDKHVFVATKRFRRQNFFFLKIKNRRVCRDKNYTCAAPANDSPHTSEAGLNAFVDFI